MVSFITQCINNTAQPEDIDKAIGEWHDLHGEIPPIWEYLGMSRAEYILYVEDPEYLEAIIEVHRKRSEEFRPKEEIIDRIRYLKSEIRSAKFRDNARRRLGVPWFDERIDDLRQEVTILEWVLGKNFEKSEE